MLHTVEAYEKKGIPGSKWLLSLTMSKAEITLNVRRTNPQKPKRKANNFALFTSFPQFLLPNCTSYQFRKFEGFGVLGGKVLSPKPNPVKWKMVLKPRIRITYGIE
jgi:hypothetical protein